MWSIILSINYTSIWQSYQIDFNNLNNILRVSGCLQVTKFSLLGLFDRLRKEALRIKHSVSRAPIKLTIVSKIEGMKRLKSLGV